MSSKYTDLTETNFPNSVDSIQRMSDLSASDLAHVNQYYTYYNAGNLTAAAQVVADYALDNKIFNAAKFNKLIDALVAVERFFKNDAYAFKGVYNASTSYTAGNTVYVPVDDDENYGMSYICLKDTVGNAPVSGASSEYWGLISQRGAKGEKGNPGANAPVTAVTPTMNGEAAIGTDEAWARGDHVHPTDTSRAAAEHTHNASDIDEGTLPIMNGGTGSQSLTAGAILRGNGTNPVTGILGQGALYATESGAPKFGTLPVSMGGTGTASFPSGSIVKANNVGMEALTGVGALYSASTGNPTFGILPVTLGGTGQTTHALNSVLIGNGNSATKNVQSAKGAFYVSTDGTIPKFGTLPIALGGTGATTKAEARAALGITSGTAEPTGGEHGDIYIQYAE